MQNNEAVVDVNAVIPRERRPKVLNAWHSLAEETAMVLVHGIGVRRQDETLLLAMNKAIVELQADGTLENIYRKWDLWDKNQLLIAGYHEEQLAEQRSTSTFRNWRTYLTAAILPRFGLCQMIAGWSSIAQALREPPRSRRLQEAKFLTS